MNTLIRGHGPDITVRVAPDPSPFVLANGDGGTTTCAFLTGTTVVGGAPCVTASDALAGRTLTVTAVGSGSPAPTLSIEMTANDAAVTPSLVSPGVWRFVAASSASPVAVAWTVTASNGINPPATVSGSEIIAADLVVPTATLTLSVAGRTVTAWVANPQGSPSPAAPELIAFTAAGQSVVGSVSGAGTQADPWSYTRSGDDEAAVSVSARLTNAAGVWNATSEITIPGTAFAAAPTLNSLSITNNLDGTYDAVIELGTGTPTGVPVYVWLYIDPDADPDPDAATVISGANASATAVKTATTGATFTSFSDISTELNGDFVVFAVASLNQGGQNPSAVVSTGPVTFTGATWTAPTLTAGDGSLTIVPGANAPSAPAAPTLTAGDGSLTIEV